METKVCCERMKKRNIDEKKSLVVRLNRIAGQINGIKNMVEEDRYCVDILNQVSAAQAALNGFSKEILTNHIHSCVVEDIRQGNVEVVDELCETIKKLMK